MKINTTNLLLIFSFVSKVLLAYFVPVFGDEAYYYIWSLHPQLSYFDHPPMVSWFIYMGHLILPAGNPLSLRIFFISANLLASVVWLKILKSKNLSEESITIWLFLFMLNPLLGPGSILATPDVPLVLFWSLSYYCYLKILNTNHLAWYTYLGIFLGLGFCSKYHIVIFVLSGLIYLLLSKKIFSLKSSGVLLTIFFGFLFSLPVVLWNSQNKWSSFLFQFEHGFGESTFEWSWPAGYLVAQLILINPFIFYYLFKKSYNFLEKTFCFSQLIFFFTSSFKTVVEGNWPLTSHLHSITHYSMTAKKEIVKYSLIYWVIIYASIGLFLISPASAPVKKNLVNSSQLNELIKIVNDYKPLYGPSYQVSSLLSWQTQSKIPKLNGLSRHDFYDSLPESQPSTTSFYVLKYDNSEWPQKFENYKKIKIQTFDNLSLALYQFTL